MERSSARRRGGCREGRRGGGVGPVAGLRSTSAVEDELACPTHAQDDEADIGERAAESVRLEGTTLTVGEQNDDAPLRTALEESARRDRNERVE